VVFLWSTTILFAEEVVFVPSFKEGDTWQFNISRKGQISSSTDQNEGIYELSVSQGAVKLYAIDGGGQKMRSQYSRMGLRKYLLRLVGKSEQRADLKFPLSVGQKWTYQYETTLPGVPRVQRRQVEINVAGMEQVTIPAGAFKAYKLIRSESWSMTSRGGFAGRNSVTSTYFYSPETKSIVKSSLVTDNNPGTIETELIKFTPGN
jgi:hypothetical protein